MPSRSLVRNIIALSALACLTRSSVVYAQDIYKTGFEPPTYHTGVLAGQDGWVAGGGSSSDITVQSSTVLSGTQSVQIHSTTSSPPTYDGRFTFFDTAPYSNKTVDVSAEFLLDSNTNAQYFFQQFDGANNLIGGFNLLGTGLYSTSSSTQAAVIFLNTKTSVDVRYDFAARTYDVLINGAAVATNQAFITNSGSTAIGVVEFGTFGGGNSNLYVDNLSVTADAVPELSTMLGFGSFVALGGLAAFRQRKQARLAA